MPAPQPKIKIDIVTKVHTTPIQKATTLFTSFKSRGGSELSKETIKNYANKINVLARLSTGKDFDGSTEWIKDFDHVISSLKEGKQKHKKDYLSGVCKILAQDPVTNKDLLAKYREALAQMKFDEDHQRGENLANIAQQESYIPLKDVKKKLAEYEADTASKAFYKLICMFYFEDEFIPRNDLSSLIYVSKTKTAKSRNPANNYVVMDGKHPVKIIMNEYKTKKTYGPQEFNVTAALAKEIEQYNELYHKENGDYVFSQSNGKTYSENAFSRMVRSATKEVLGKSMTADWIRSLIITDFRAVPHSINEEDEFARRCLHGASVSREYAKLNLMRKPKEDEESVEDEPEEPEEETKDPKKLRLTYAEWKKLERDYNLGK